jgi:capsular polysaccharide biosynthesis protein
LADLPQNYGPDFETVLSQETPSAAGVRPVTRHHQCFITHSGLGLKRLRLLEATSFEHLPPHIRRHFKRYARYKFFTEPRLRLRQSNLLLIHNHWSTGYFHWVTDVLVKLRFVDLSDYVVLLPEDYPPFARESLRLFDAEVLPVPDGHGLSANLLTIVHNRPPGGFHPEHVNWLRETFTSRCGRGTTGPRRIYITRPPGLLRRVENDDEVAEVVAGYGFDPVDTAQMSFCDQVRSFSRAEALISVHGAGLANGVFMPLGAQVLELYRELSPAGPVMNTSYWKLSRAAGLRYYYQFCAHGQNFGGDIDRVNIIVDVDRLRANIELMLSAQTSAG